jgi:ABC-type arginine/histidine transport system permease subunit
VLPASLLGFHSLAYISRMTRSFMLAQLSQEFIITARVKGLTERQVIWNHAFRNILVQLLTVVALAYGSLLEGAVLIETVFSWPGFGSYLTGSLLLGDFNQLTTQVVHHAVDHGRGDQRLTDSDLFAPLRTVLEQVGLVGQAVYTLEIVKGTEMLNAFFRSGLNCTVLALTLNTCAYTTEIFAGAIRSVPHGEIEAARAYGFSSVKLYRCIILPSALRIALPAYSNEVILMLHSTALAFTATVPDLLKIARDINSATYQPFTAFGIAAVLYLIISYVLISLFRKAEKRWLQHIKPTSTH